MSDVNFTVQSCWTEVQTDLRNCAGCRDIIFSEMYQFTIQVNTEKPEMVNNLSFCKSCYETMLNDSAAAKPI